MQSLLGFIGKDKKQMIVNQVEYIFNNFQNKQPLPVGEMFYNTVTGK